MVTKTETLLMDHNLLGLAIPFFPKAVVDLFGQIPQEDSLSGSSIEFPLLFTKDPGFNLTLYLGWAEAIGCERNDKLCGRIVLEPDDVHLHRGDDEEEDYDV